MCHTLRRSKVHIIIPFSNIDVSILTVDFDGNEWVYYVESVGCQSGFKYCLSGSQTDIFFKWEWWVESTNVVKITSVLVRNIRRDLRL